MVGAAIKGLSKILRKELRKSPVLGKYVKTGKKPVRRSKKYEEALKKRPRGTPTKAGLVHKRNLLRGDEPAAKKDTYLSRRAKLAGVTGVKKQPEKTYKSGLKEGMITGALAGAAGTYMAGKSKSAKDATAKTKKAAEEHIKKDKKKKEKQKK